MTYSSQRRRLLAAAAAGLLLAGCGGSSPNSHTNTAAASTSGSVDGTTSTARRSTTTATSATVSGTTDREAGLPGALAFSKCMRANGVSNFPDPQPGGGFAFQAGAGVIASPAFRTAQAKCQRFMPGGGPLSPGPPASAQTMALLRRIASCMRQHDVPQFPDPRSTPPPQSSVKLRDYAMITNYRGAILMYPATIDMQSPAYNQAVAACGAGFLAGPHAH